MTTIAYKDGIIAYDSRSTESNGFIFDDHKNKNYVRDNLVFFGAGPSSDIISLIDCFIEGKVIYDTPIEAVCFVYDRDKRKLLKTGIMEEPRLHLWWLELEQSKVYALGSGHDLAIAAMDYGATAEEAVRYAATRDCFTGGDIWTFKLDDR